MRVPVQARVKVGRKVRLNQEWLAGSKHTRWRGGPAVRVVKGLPTQVIWTNMLPLSSAASPRRFSGVSSCQRLLIKTLKIIQEVVADDLDE